MMSQARIEGILGVIQEGERLTQNMVNENRRDIASSLLAAFQCVKIGNELMNEYIELRNMIISSGQCPNDMSLLAAGKCLKCGMMYFKDEEA